MLNYMMVYIVELIIFATIWVIGSILFLVKFRKGLLKFFIISFCIFFIIFLITFIFEKPQMSLEEIEKVEVKSTMNIKKPTTFYHFKDVTNDVTIKHNVDLNKVGDYDIQFELNTLTGKFVKSDTVHVVDTLAPEIKIEGEENCSISYSKEYEEKGASATDLYDGEIEVETSKEEINENEYNIKYTAKDSSGNISQKIRHVTIVDDIAPKITLKGKSNIYLKINEQYKEEGATANDEKEGDLTDKISVEGSVDTSKEGEYIIKYVVSDSKGNSAEKKRKVMVSNLPYVTAQDGSNGDKGVIYLTFDDGPTSSSTPKILDILSKKNINATFFTINYDSAGENLVKREYNEGHTVAIHGYSHDYKTIYQSVDTYMENITKQQNKIKNTTGYNSTITRFPGGSSNTISRRYCEGIMTVLCKEVVSRGYKYFDWNVNSGDADTAKTPDDVFNNVTKGISKERANVVLMHDFSGNTKTINALERIIDYGLENGYTFKKITEQTEMVTHKPNN